MKKWLPAVLLVGAFVSALYLGATQIDNFWSAFFNPGSNEELSALLGDVDHYFLVGTQDVEDDCECYIADFSEYVDEVNIKFFNRCDIWNTYFYWNN